LTVRGNLKAQFRELVENGARLASMGNNLQFLR
jgi:hypothetical protein